MLLSASEYNFRTHERMDLVELLERPEGKTLEFKRNLTPESALETIGAFANTAGGAPPRRMTTRGTPHLGVGLPRRLATRATPTARALSRALGRSV